MAETNNYVTQFTGATANGGAATNKSAEDVAGAANGPTSGSTKKNPSGKIKSKSKQQIGSRPGGSAQTGGK